MTKIYLDGGHGGKDSGAIGNGLFEKNLTLSICQKIKEELEEYENTEVLMSRDSDVYLSLDERTRKANNWGADLLVSVHINASGNSTAKGFETFVYPNVDSRTQAFQNVMHQEILREINKYGITDRGKKSKDLHMLRASKMTSLLTENLFISNPADSALLKRADFIQSVVMGHVIGIEKFVGLKKSQQPPRNDGSLYRVQVGAFSDRENAEQLVKELADKGYKSFITE
jgi:N-acetylmuramoyl-L-alanine amidase